MLLALPFRYRYEINFAREATPGRSRDIPPGPAHYESMGAISACHSRPDQGLRVCGGLARMGLACNCNPYVQPLEPDRDLLDRQH